MPDIFFLNLKPKTEAQLFFHFFTPIWLLELFFFEYKKENKKFSDFLKHYPCFFEKDAKEINWSSDSKFFYEKIKLLTVDLESNNININLPFRIESISYIQEITKKIINKIANSLVITLTSAIQFDHHPTNPIALKGISNLFHFKKIHLSIDNFDEMKSALIATIELLSKQLIEEIINKSSLVNFSSSYLQLINERLKPITQENLPLLNAYKITEEFKTKIIKSYELSNDQKKLLLECKALLEEKQKSLPYLLHSRDKIKDVFNELLDKTHPFEVEWAQNFVTSLELEPLLSFRDPIKIITHDLSLLRKKIFVSFTPEVDQLEKDLSTIDLILNYPPFFKLTPDQPGHIPTALIDLFLNYIKELGNQLIIHFANFQLKQIGLILDNKEEGVSLIFSEDKRIKKALETWHVPGDKIDYATINTSGIIEKIQNLINLLQRITNKSAYLSSDFSDSENIINEQFSTSVEYLASPPVVNYYAPPVTPPHDQQISTEKGYISSILPLPSQLQISSAPDPSTKIETKKISDPNLNTLNQAAFFSHPASAARPNDMLLQAAKNFLNTIILSASNKKIDLKNILTIKSELKKQKSYSLNPINFLKSMIASTPTPINLPEESDEDIFDALRFFNHFIKQQEDFLRSLHKEKTSLQDVMYLLEKGNLREWLITKKNTIINPILSEWVKNFAESREYENSRENLILAFNEPEHKQEPFSSLS